MKSGEKETVPTLGEDELKIRWEKIRGYFPESKTETED